MDIRDKAEQLVPYIELSNDEWGELLQALCTMVRYAYGTSKEFQLALEKEIDENLKYINENVTIIETTKTVEHTVTTKELEFN